MKTQLSEKPGVVLITGSSTGFGRLTAETLARKGYEVYASMRNLTGKNAANAEALQALAKKENLKLHVVEIDVTNDESAERGASAVIEKAGRIDVLINNAGVMYWGITEGYTLEQARNQFEPNFFGVIRLNRAVLPQMRRQQSGLIISISSLAGGLTFPFFALYCASKQALESLALGYRYDLTAFGIDCVVVEPGPFATNLLETNDPPRDTDRAAAYGELGSDLQHLIQSLEGGMQDAQLVADDIAKLIEIPFGARPFRTIPGSDFGMSPLNTAKDQAQHGLLQALNLEKLEATKISDTV
ncbi:MAG: SDR family oxidoreductase [Rhizobacter sp.]|nr:SDR family oxidoreductase [Chlorobiales bacterium]